MSGFKLPQSVLVVIYTPRLEVLLLARADHPGFWQSVTGSRANELEPLAVTCARETFEETGRREAPEAFEDWQITHRYQIYPHWRHRYASGITHNEEHVFGLRVPALFDPQLSLREHTGFQWLPWREAADACFSWSNAQAVRFLASRAGAV